MLSSIRPVWVHAIPEQLDPGVLYVSVDYALATHLCACGCGSEVVTPLAPGAWKLLYDGGVSLSPSIGNWSYPCRSHYWIQGNQVTRAANWSAREISAARQGSSSSSKKHKGEEGGIRTSSALGRAVRRLLMRS